MCPVRKERRAESLFSLSNRELLRTRHFTVHTHPHTVPTHSSPQLTQSASCQTDDWASHKKNCIPECVRGIIINCEKDKWQDGIHYLFHPVDIRQDHPIHKFGEACPVSKVVGVPLIMYRHIRVPWMKRSSDEYDAGLDNQIATYLMIDRVNGIAPPEFVQVFPEKKFCSLLISVSTFRYQKQVGKVWRAVDDSILSPDYSPFPFRSQSCAKTESR